MRNSGYGEAWGLDTVRSPAESADGGATARRGLALEQALPLAQAMADPYLWSRLVG